TANNIAMQGTLEAIAEPRRREILRLVRSDELPAGAIAQRFADVTRPAISQHLKVLREAGLVTERREGPRRLHRARPGGLAALPAGAIAQRFADVTRPAISQHLKVLREAGLVTERREGTRRLYRARPEGLAELREFLDQFWDDRLENLRVHAERAEREERHAR